MHKLQTPFAFILLFNHPKFSSGIKFPVKGGFPRRIELVAAMLKQVLV
jgi:hypothetical protein